jgi:hypothetical protein
LHKIRPGDKTVSLVNVPNKFTKNGGFNFCRRSAENKGFLKNKDNVRLNRNKTLNKKRLWDTGKRGGGLKGQNINFNEDRQGGGGRGWGIL